MKPVLYSYPFPLPCSIFFWILWGLSLESYLYGYFWIQGESSSAFKDGIRAARDLSHRSMQIKLQNKWWALLSWCSNSWNAFWIDFGFILISYIFESLHFCSLTGHP
jgi:hypothetical protein